MRGSVVARNYAQALFELAGRTEEHHAFADAFDTLERLLSADPRVYTFLDTPRIDVAAKQHALRTALAHHVPERFLNFLFVVLDKRRQRFLPAITREYRALLDEHRGVLNARVTLAREVDERTEEDIAASLSRLLGRKVLPRIEVDPDILGGIVVRYGDRILDASLRRRLARLRTRLLGVALPATART